MDAAINSYEAASGYIDRYFNSKESEATPSPAHVEDDSDVDLVHLDGSQYDSDEYEQGDDSVPPQFVADYADKVAAVELQSKLDHLASIGDWMAITTTLEEAPSNAHVVSAVNKWKARTLMPGPNNAGRAAAMAIAAVGSSRGAGAGSARSLAVAVGLYRLAEYAGFVGGGLRVKPKDDPTPNEGDDADASGDDASKLSTADDTVNSGKASVLLASAAGVAAYMSSAGSNSETTSDGHTFTSSKIIVKPNSSNSQSDSKSPDKARRSSSRPLNRPSNLDLVVQLIQKRDAPTRYVRKPKFVKVGKPTKRATYKTVTDQTKPLGVKGSKKTKRKPPRKRSKK